MLVAVDGSRKEDDEKASNMLERRFWNDCRVQVTMACEFTMRLLRQSLNA